MRLGRIATAGPDGDVARLVAAVSGEERGIESFSPLHDQQSSVYIPVKSQRQLAPTT